ncbi:MAG: type 1 glutamine amidotransferase, partial [Pseudomonadota bacterium]
MKIGILQTGKVNEALVGRWGEYPEMVAAMLSAEAPEFTYATWAVLDGEMPDNPTACDAWIVPGSRHGVYDPLPWIAPLKAFLRASRQAGRPILGICF